MVRPRSSFKESPWLPPSQVFTDTSRVDLFNDPPWETGSDFSFRRTPDESRRPLRWTAGKAGSLRRLFVKRGRHSRHLA
jgi:hypothetical protein